MIGLKADPSDYEIVTQVDRHRLRYNAPFDGLAIALQWVAGRWYPLPLAYSGTAVRILAGRGTLPNSDELSIELQDIMQIGLHRLVLLMHADDDALAQLDLAWGVHIPLPQLDHLAAVTLAKPQDRWRVMQLNLMFGVKAVQSEAQNQA